MPDRGSAGAARAPVVWNPGIDPGRIHPGPCRFAIWKSLLPVDLSADPESVRMTFEILLMLGLIVATLIVFMFEIFPIEVTAMGLLGLLLVLGLISLDQAVLGLSNKAVVTVGCMFVLSHALTKTGLLEVIENNLISRVRQRTWLGVTVVLCSASLLSGFLNNTAMVAIFIPLTMNLCRKFKLSPSKVLIPLSYVSILGGTLTLIGTSTNLLVSSMAEEAGQGAIGMFEFTKLGIVFLATGLAYILIFANRLLPSRAVVSSLTRKYHLGSYLTELRLVRDSKLVGKTCREVGVNQNYDIIVLAILRGTHRFTEKLRDMRLEAQDILIVRGQLENIMRLRKDQEVALLTDIKLNEEELSAGGQTIAEALVSQTSPLVGKTLKEIDFRRHYGAFVLAIRRHRETLRAKIAHIPLKFADTLLIMAPGDRLAELRRSEDVVILSEVDLVLKKERFWWVVIVLIPVIIILSAAGLLDITKGAVLATTLLLLIGAIKPTEAYRSVDWSVVFLIAAFVPVGRAMVETGTAQFLGERLLQLRELFPAALAVQVAVSLTYLTTSMLTQMISNNATAIIMVPVSLSMASAMQMDPRPLLIAVCFAASAEFMTPMGYQTNMMVYGPGSYRFLDYTRFGAPLNLTFWALATFLIPIFWG